MKKQEILNVGWKYLLVLLGFYAVYTYTNNRSHGLGRMHKMGGDHKMMMKMGGDSHMGIDGIEKQIEVRKEVNADGDTTMTVTVNGEEMDPSAMGDHEIMWIEKMFMEVELGAVNWSLYRYQRIPITIYSQKTLTEMDMENRDKQLGENEQPPNNPEVEDGDEQTTYDEPNQLVKNEFLSGWYVIALNNIPQDAPMPQYLTMLPQ